MSNGDQEPIGPDWRRARLIGIAGALGGGLSWVYATYVGEPPAQSWYAAIPAYAALGCGASVISVFLLTNTDLRDFMRALAFALACGFAWRPVYEAGSALVEREVDQAAAEDAGESGKRARGALADASAGRRPAAEVAIEVVEAAVEGLHGLSRVKGAAASAAIERELQGIAYDIAELETLDPKARIAHLRRLGEVAAGDEIPSVASLAADLIAGIGRSTADPAVPDGAPEAREALDSIRDRAAEHDLQSIETHIRLLDASVLEAPLPADFEFRLPPASFGAGPRFRLPQRP